MRLKTKTWSGKQPASPAGLGEGVFLRLQQSKKALFLISWFVVLCQITWFLHTLIFLLMIRGSKKRRKSQLSDLLEQSEKGT
jgi:hypothetical protein